WSQFEHDGDLDLHMTLDGSFVGLLRPGNHDISDTLVVEVPCQGPIDQLNALHTCDQYPGPRVAVPPVGTHIVAAAHHVQDRNHGMWAELHGANIRVLPR